MRLPELGGSKVKVDLRLIVSDLNFYGFPFPSPYLQLVQQLLHSTTHCAEKLPSHTYRLPLDY